MPELPEVETMCRGIRPIIGARIARVIDPKCTYRPIVCQPPLKSLSAKLRGQQVTGVSRIGKRVVIEVDPWALVLQPKMTGLVAIDQPPGPEHVRLILELEQCEAPQLIFWDRRGLGTIELLRLDQLQGHLVDGKLGPDALSITVEQFTARLSATRRSIKVALLDQKLLAGVGNLYASEMLHAAAIDPRAGCDQLDWQRYVVLHQHMQRILNEAILYEGSTLSDGTYRNALNQSGGYQNEHKVYDRAGEVCLTCHRGTIERIVQAQRATFWCPACQK